MLRGLIQVRYIFLAVSSVQGQATPGKRRGETAPVGY